MRLDVVTIFPDYFTPLDLSLIGRARRDGLIDLHVHDLRQFTHDRHRTVDDTPFGGGAGMVMKAQPWAEALAHLVGDGDGQPVLVVPSPAGQPFDQAMARELSTRPRIAFACGRFEGIDERVLAHASDDLGLEVRLVSMGDYVLNGGEVAALAMIEAIVRLVPGVVGNPESLVEESHENGLLEYPTYTQPAVWSSPQGVERAVPPVLLSGDHGAVARWRLGQQRLRTARRRPDLLHMSQTLDGDAGLDGLDVAEASPADAPELLVLQRAAWLPEVHACAGEWEGPMETVDEIVAAMPGWRTWTVRCGGRLIGSVRAHLVPDRPGVWEIGRLMVAPDLHGRGLGRRLLEFAEGSAPAGTDTFWLTTGADFPRNRRFYRRAGYRVRRDSTPETGTVDLEKRRA